MSDYFVTNFYPNNVNKNFAFRGVTNPTPQNKNEPQITQQPDTVSFSTKNKKEGLLNGAKWGFGALAVAGVATLAYVLSKGKVGSKQTKQIVEQVEFEPAKTIEEAKKFAENTLKIQYNDYQYANLDLLNTINEMCSKHIKLGKFFDVIHFEKPGTCNIENPMSFSPISKGEFNAKVLRINTDYINKFDDFFKYVFEHDGRVNLNKIIKRNDNGTYVLTKQEYGSAFVNKFINKLNLYNNKSSYKDKLEIYDGFSEMIANYNNILKGKNQMSDFSFDGSFLHEAGHSVHYSSNQNLFKTLLDEKNELVKEFQNNKEIRQTALKVSDYATTCPLEFVAEVWKRVQKGMTFSDDVMALYKKYGGPAVS